MGQADDRAAQRFFSSGEQHPGNDFIWGGGELVAAWPDSAADGAYDRVRTSNVETLLIGGELDFATPPQVATKQLLPHLPNGHQVVLDGIGHSDSFWAEQPEAGTRLINTFFDSGRVDDSLYEPGRVDFTPEVTQTALAKGFAGTMVGLALLMVLSLVWMARRVRKRGRFGRKAGAALRTLYPIVLGLGGWFLGVLVVITTMPGVPLDDELLAVVSVGLPIGLGIYYAWVDRERPARTRTAGIVAATTGALIGAWLGFNATADLLALVTSIAGAAAGANLILLVLDIARERSASALASASPRRTSAPVEA